MRLIHRFQLSFVRDKHMNIISLVGRKDFLLITSSSPQADVGIEENRACLIQ